MWLKRLPGWLHSRFTALVLLVLLLAAAAHLILSGPGHPPSELMTLEHQYPISVLVFTRDGRALAVGGGLVGYAVELTLWDLAGGPQRVFLCGPGASVESLAFNPDNTTVVTRHYDGVVRRWATGTGAEQATLRSKQCSVWGALSPDGSCAAWPGLDQTVQLWDLLTDTLRAVLPIRAHRCLAWAPDGTTLAVEVEFGGQEIWLCDPTTGEVQVTLRTFTGPVTRLAFSPDGHRLAVGGIKGAIEVWDRRTGQLVWSGHSHAGAVWALAFSPDGATLASGAQDGSIVLWDAATGDERTSLRKHASQVRALAFSPDGTRLASGGSDGKVILWDVSTAQRR
jgi:WD40 repeat protein